MKGQTKGNLGAQRIRTRPRSGKVPSCKPGPSHRPRPEECPRCRAGAGHLLALTYACAGRGRGGGRPGHHGLCSSIPGLSPLEASSALLPPDNQVSPGTVSEGTSPGGHQCHSLQDCHRVVADLLPRLQAGNSCLTLRPKARPLATGAHGLGHHHSPLRTNTSSRQPGQSQFPFSDVSKVAYSKLWLTGLPSIGGVQGQLLSIALPSTFTGKRRGKKRN